jgi:hypothetical protein
MTAAFTRSVMLLALCLATVACGDIPPSPSQSSLIQGTVNLTVGQLARGHVQRHTRRDCEHSSRLE